LPLGTVTATLASDPRRVAAGERVKDEIDVREWLGGPTRETVKEESLGLGAYGKVLTILTSTKIGQELDPDEQDEERELMESRTPRFKR